MAAVNWVAGDKITATKLLAMESGHLVTPSIETTITNTTTEFEFAEFSIPANTAAVGQCWRLQAWGVWACTGTPTLQFRLRVGANTTASSNNQQAASGAIAANGTATNRLFTSEVLLVCQSIGATGAVFGPMTIKTAGYLAGTAPFINDAAEITTIMDGTAATTIDTTGVNYISLTAQYSAASSSNTLICKGFIAEKMVG